MDNARQNAAGSFILYPMATGLVSRAEDCSASNAGAHLISGLWGGGLGFWRASARFGFAGQRRCRLAICDFFVSRFLGQPKPAQPRRFLGLRLSFGML